MPAIVPSQRPELSRTSAVALLKAHGIIGPALLGRRGYYRDTMGTVGKNDRGIYDDAIMLLTPTCYETFNANCDPSVRRAGIAVLKAGVWDYRIGIHNISKDPLLHPHYTALVQAAPVTVVRDDGATETGYFGINIHRGSLATTSSEGCQTVYPKEWDDFISTVQDEMAAHHLNTIPYVLTERADT